MNDEELATYLWQIAKNDSLASSRIGFPSADTMSKMKSAITCRDQQIALAARIEGRLEMLRAISATGKDDMLWYGVNSPEVLAVLPEYFATSTADIPTGKKDFLSFMEEQTLATLKENKQ